MFLNRPSKLAAFLIVVAAGTLSLVAAGTLTAQETSRAAVIVRLGDDEVASRCVEFSEQQISGYEVLQRSGLSIEAKIEGQGGLACRIEDIGCPADDCFCQCKGGDSCIYWSYWQQLDDGWRYAQVGATSHQVIDGSVEGWSWGPGSLTDAIEPPNLSFDEVCSDTEPIASNVDESADMTIADLLPIVGFIVVLALLGLGFVLLRRRESRR